MPNPSEVQVRLAVRTSRAADPLAPAGATALSLAQQSAIDLLAVGKTDSETAAALGVHRVTITRWRLYGAEFRAALAVRRAGVWGAAADRLRALIPQALDVLAEAMADEANPDRTDVALAVLKLAGPLPVGPADPLDPRDYIRLEVEAEAARTPTAKQRLHDRLDRLPSYEDRAEAARVRLAQLAGEEPTENAAQAGD